MKKVNVFILVVILFSLPITCSQNRGVGIGISTYSINISGSILDYYVTTIRIINPSDYEINAKVYFECLNCIKEVKIFNTKIAEKTIDYRSFFTLDKSDLTIKPQSYGENAAPVKLIFSPKFITKNYLKVYTPEGLNFLIKLINKKYDNNFVIPYYSLFIGERRIQGLIVSNIYSSSFGPLGVTPSVGTNVSVQARGMPVSSFIILLVLLALIAFYIKTKIDSKKKKSR
jgi:hypothetical protein